MKYIKFTYVDSITGVSVVDAPAINGPSLPIVEGIKFKFALESQYPTDVAIMYGECSGDPVGISGIIGVITKAQFEEDLETELSERVTIDEALDIPKP